jgi:glutamate-1-semialdehyde 2,1-aminomutase
VSTTERQDIDAALAKAAAEIREAVPSSAELFDAASEVVPDGFSRARFFWPIPMYVERAEGPYVYDIDDQKYIDCMLGFGVLLVGHCHPKIIGALHRQLDLGTHYGAAVRDESDLAGMITEHVPGAEQVVFVNSGTEATLAAVRLARAATGRDKVAKFEGGWHGWNDFLMYSTITKTGGDVRTPLTVPNSLGLTQGVQQDIVVLPFNHEAAFDRIRDQADNLACVIVEAVQGSAGCLVGDPAFLTELEQVCREAGVLFVLDEVITGFRLGASGAAGRYGLTPDLTTLGKAIGGGLPVGAVCGRRDLLTLTAPNEQGDHAILAGTFSGNPMTLTAGRAQLELMLDDPDAYAHLDRLGARMRAGLTAALGEAGVRGHVTGIGSLWGLHLLTETVPTNVRESAGFAETGGMALTGYLLRERVLMEAPVHLGFVCTKHTDELVDDVIEAHVRALHRMKSDGVLGQ